MSFNREEAKCPSHLTNRISHGEVTGNFRQWRTAIAVTAAILFTVFAIIASILGAGSVLALVRRTWRLVRPNSTCRPSRTARYQLDYFQWNFLFGFVYIAALLAVAVAIAHTLDNTAVLLVSLPLPLLAFQISSQLVLGSMLVWLRAKYPFRVSSMAKGALVRPGVYTIIEDVVAVDGGQGVHFRQLLDARYDSSKALQALLQRMGWAWGLSGLGVSILLLALIGSLTNKEISFVLGWSVPWVWVTVLTLLTYFIVRTAQTSEEVTAIA
ncbi:uncharacterized protein P174DRAFT_454419 [Aspergillus novofumigatus IBT 16806]|uniref:Uncharacterized protein n=1 Tax=Aspergillus novofumigatus (strain IBT 16806) TaxID=1392255 RepID=A0A2I1BYB0_ASPN1|nr:uncharacterized protein P174DRAFT_454419 [Aspergillus novofumigatus IBT 16806]PKX90358.1 hypothetical protein P174DRAFT_454419 [Aspergillus novofumigatus IBT 16806]